ncbi:MAG: F420-0--gamma-glutamyl ligase [Candidatus Liptonbacteria bacterium]|nr:F420-0--gamma-glutamyl ligase [Candidatus Liptonbacteria bacterium]
MTPIKEVEGIRYERIPVRTHHIQFGESLEEIIKRYAIPLAQKGDWIAISEKVVSICQNNVRHISTVKAGWLAKLIVKGVKKYPNDIGFSRPEKMQLAVELAGHPRIILAMLLGAIGKMIGVRGIFWRVAGHRISEIDGFNPASMDPYKEYAALPPKEPEKVCIDLESKTGLGTVIIDGNNINVEVIATSASVPVDKKIARLILLDNPMGQDDEMTPIILVRNCATV